MVTPKDRIIKAFQLFVAHDDRMDSFKNPFEFNGRIYATDATALIRTDKKNYVGEFSDKYALQQSVEAIVPTSTMNVPLNLSKEMFEKYRDVDETEDYAECNKCDGEGEVEWSFEHHSITHDCPECNGSGLDKSGKPLKTGKKVFGHYLVKIRDSYFQLRLFYRLLETQELIGEPIFLAYQQDNNSASLFKVGCCEVLMMPSYFNGVDEWDGIINISELTQI